VFDNPDTTGKIAMLVAGYEQADTSKAVTTLMTEKLSTAKDFELKRATTTTAESTTI
jgi:hypothetical protein